MNSPHATLHLNADLGPCFEDGDLSDHLQHMLIDSSDSPVHLHEEDLNDGDRTFAYTDPSYY